MELGVGLGLSFIVFLLTVAWGVLQWLTVQDLRAELQDKDNPYIDYARAEREFAQAASISTLVYHLTLIEKLIYLSPGDTVPKRTLLEILLKLGQSWDRKEEVRANTERGSIYRHGNNGLESAAEQALVDWARGLEKRSDNQASRDSGMG